MAYIVLPPLNIKAHSCSFPGCGSVLVMDGNMKNRRDVCFAKDAGYIQFDGLSGSIKTGCPASPAFKSRYCLDHVNQACTLVQSEEIDEDLAADYHPNNDREVVAEMILAKKTTRKQTYYQVSCMHGCGQGRTSGTYRHVHAWITCRFYGLGVQSVMLHGNQKNHFLRV